jgi:membrane protease YdiL (CAAX protease family)
MADRRQWLSLAFVCCALGLFFGISAEGYLRPYRTGTAEAITIYVCLLLLVILLVLPGFDVSRRWLAPRARNRKWPAYSVGFFLLPYLIYAAGTGDFRWTAFGKLLALAGLPFGLYAVIPVRRPAGMKWQDAVVLLWLTLPVLFRWVGGIWNVPVNLDFMVRAFLIGVGSWSFLVWRGLEGVGYEFRFSKAILGASLMNFAFFATIAIPLGFALGFIAWNARWEGAWKFFFNYVTIFLFIALLEELTFRGLLQNLLEKSWNSRYGAQAAVSVIFGFSHILHAPFPNWPYVGLAALAGWFYGSAWRKERSLMASAIAHALVDTLWRAWFTRPG